MAERLLNSREARGYLDGKIGRLDPHTLLAELRRKDRDYRPNLPRPEIIHLGKRPYYKHACLDRLVAAIQQAEHPVVDSPVSEPKPADKAELHLPNGMVITLPADTARKIAAALISRSIGAAR